MDGKNKCCCCGPTPKRSGRQRRTVAFDEVPTEITTYSSPPLLVSPNATPLQTIYLPEDYFGDLGDSDEFDEEEMLAYNASRPVGSALEEDGGEAPPLTVFGANQNYTPSTQSGNDNLGLGCLLNQNLATTSLGYRHDPDGIFWLTTPWVTWDNIPISNLCGLSKAQIKAFVWPSSGWQMRGLREEFYSDPPFADNNDPSPIEIENWNLRVIAHYRRLLGVTLPVQNSRDLYLRASFNDERKWTTYWDQQYPGENGTSYGPCVGSNNAHCGASFIPNCPDQLYKLLPDEPCVVNTAGSEGVFGGEMDWPWAIKLSRVLFKIVEAEGLTGHGGPFVNRPYVGMSFFCHPESGNFTVRIKWNGPLVNACP